MSDIIIIDNSVFAANSSKSGIPGLDMDGKDMSTETFIQTNRKYTYTKKIDRSFAAAWEGKTQPPPVSHHQYHRGEQLYSLYPLPEK